MTEQSHHGKFYYVWDQEAASHTALPQWGIEHPQEENGSCTYYGLALTFTWRCWPFSYSCQIPNHRFLFSSSPAELTATSCTYIFPRGPGQQRANTESFHCHAQQMKQQKLVCVLLHIKRHKAIHPLAVAICICFNFFNTTMVLQLHF